MVPIRFFAVVGLSPRLRGNGQSRSVPSQFHGSIPALAGERSTVLVGRSMTRVYPRACGGTTDLQMSWKDEWGLSPRLRGNDNWRYWQRLWLGSIPALAGERWEKANPPDPPRVYPRACGGTRRLDRYEQLEGGLSPRLRGNGSG